MIELTGEYEFAAPQELVWQMLMDPEVLSMTIAGCERLERVDETTLLGRLNLRVGPVQGLFHGKVESTDVHPPSSMHMIVSGNGPAGAVRGEGNITLEAMPMATRLHYDGTVHVNGRIASVGQRVMDSSAKSIVRQSLQNLEKQIQVQITPEPKPEPDTEMVAARSVPASPDAPSQTEFMVNVARDVLQDLIPDSGQRKVIVGVGLVAVIVALINGFANLVARRVAKILRED